MGYREETVMVCFNCRAKADMYATTCRNCGRPQTAVPMRKKPSMDARINWGFALAGAFGGIATMVLFFGGLHR